MAKPHEQSGKLRDSPLFKTLKWVKLTGDVLVWNSSLRPTEPRLSLTTGFKATNCGTVPMLSCSQPGTGHMHKAPNPGS